ncbi:MAG: hypothetical protein A3F18_04950 [Legionellales bacterium RIFCSPHIGHO2_12_FULL_37_14]|nr:MAG: hypothetical protein A3F18_04950 [Legionellales bacterium RIFCSPHIGHO2_12_FULL_37_14]
MPSIACACDYCGIPISEGDCKLCGACMQDPNLSTKIIAPYPYIEPLRSFIHQYKYVGGLYLSSALSHLIKQFIQGRELPEVLIPMPMHYKRMQERGFNHTILLAQHLSRWLKIPYDITACKKIKNTVSQASLKAKERKVNLADTFTTTKNNYKYVAIIDDVYTTGSTIQALTHSLKKSGVARVEAWCIARTCPNL